jgi:N-formylglutamate amidohydrolase
MHPGTNIKNAKQEQKSSLILHIPHASKSIPFSVGFIDSVKTRDQIEILTDWYTDELFDDEESIKVIADFSRVFCDVERFKDDALEKMSSLGMGLLYTHSDDGSLMRNINTETRNKIISEFYEPHHERLTAAVDLQLKHFGTANIIDCHSYTDNPLKRDLNQNLPRPDFNIGINSYHTPVNWIEESKYFFESGGYSLGIDWPYSGTMVPLKYFNTDSRIHSIMLEVNRRLYLKQNSIERSEDFDKIKKIILDWLEIIRA